MKGLAFPGSFQAVPATGDGVYSLCLCWADAMVTAISSSGKTSLFINFSIYANLNKNSHPPTLNSQLSTLNSYPSTLRLIGVCPSRSVPSCSGQRYADALHRRRHSCECPKSLLLHTYRCSRSCRGSVPHQCLQYWAHE
mgnify:CR=1 FL=1